MYLATKNKSQESLTSPYSKNTWKLHFTIIGMNLRKPSIFGNNLSNWCVLEYWTSIGISNEYLNSYLLCNI